MTGFILIMAELTMMAPPRRCVQGLLGVPVGPQALPCPELIFEEKKSEKVNDATKMKERGRGGTLMTQPLVE